MGALDLNIFRACAAKARTTGEIPLPPYQYVEVTEANGYWETSHCDLCGHQIRYEFQFTGRTGTPFKLGSSCGPALIAQIDELEYRQEFAAEFSKAKNALTCLKRLKRLYPRLRDGSGSFKEALTFAHDALLVYPRLLTDQPHPKLSWRTLRDYVEWILAQPTCRHATKFEAAEKVIAAWGTMQDELAYRDAVLDEVYRERL